MPIFFLFPRIASPTNFFIPWEKLYDDKLHLLAEYIE